MMTTEVYVDENEQCCNEAAQQIGRIYAGLIAIGFISSMLSALVADNIELTGSLSGQPYTIKQVDCITLSP